MKKIIYSVLALILATNLFSYELPTIAVSKDDGKPEIIFFTAQSVVVNEKLSYILKWKTRNATKVRLTYLGDMALDGNVTVTKEEFHNGAVTLRAYSDKSDYVDKITLNGKEEVFDETNPVPKNTSKETRQFYDSIPNTHINPYRRRINPGMYPRRY